MLKKSASFVLASLRGSTFWTRCTGKSNGYPEYASSLRSLRPGSPPGGCDGLFEHPAGYFDPVSHRLESCGSMAPIECFNNLLGLRTESHHVMRMNEKRPVQSKLSALVRESVKALMPERVAKVFLQRWHTWPASSCGRFARSRQNRPSNLPIPDLRRSGSTLGAGSFLLYVSQFSLILPESTGD
jgi:hypothetical protein